MIRRRALFAGAASLALAAPAGAADRLAIVGATLLRPDADPLDDAVILVEDGEIAEVGEGLAVPAGAERIEAKGKVVTAGLCEPLTQLGLVEIDLEKSSRDTEHDEEDDPIRAAFLAADGYNPASSLVAIARQQGVTSAVVVPRGGLITGQSAWVDLAGATPPEAIARRRCALHVVIDDGAFGHYEGSRGSALLRLREVLADADAFRKDRRGYDRRQLRELGQSRLDLEAVVDALEGRLPTVIHVDRASDIVAAIALAEEHGLKLALASAAEGWRVASQIADAEVPVLLYPLDHGPRHFAARGAREDNAALLHRAGVTLGLSTGESHNARKLRQVAGNAVRAGLPKQAALGAVTEGPARVFGMSDYGSPKKGRVANLVVWSADPFELSTKVEAVVVRGRRRSLRSRQTALFERYR